MKASLKRDTAETSIEVSLNTKGTGICEQESGVQLLDQLLRTLASEAGFDLKVKASGDLKTGDHHTVEDVGITLGCVLARLAEKGIGMAIVPCGESLAIASVRFGEPGYTGRFCLDSRDLEGMQLENLGHFFRSLAYNGRFTLHLSAEGGDDVQKIDAMSAALGFALSQALSGRKKE